MQHKSEVVLFTGGGDSQRAARAFREAIVSVLGRAPAMIDPGKLHRFPTSDKRGDRAGWCKLFSDCSGGAFGDWRSGVVESWSPTRCATMTRSARATLARQVQSMTRERDAAQRVYWAKSSRRIDELWAQCAPLEHGDVVTRYLEQRGISSVCPLPECLRLHRALPYWDGEACVGDFPAMVAPLVSPEGRVVALHRTYLTGEGRKAKVPTVKKLTAAAGPLAGACIPLHGPDRGVIGIAEGIETALAAWAGSGVPTLAAYSAGSLASWKWQADVRRVVIFADNDRAGLTAATALRERLLATGLNGDVLAPIGEGMDWCDVWSARDGVEGGRA